MKSRLVGAIALIALAAVIAVVPMGASAQNADPNARAEFVSKIVRKGTPKGTKARLRVRYQCSGGDHLWVSAKQTKSGEKAKALKKEGSSRKAKTWLQSHRNPFVCDGTSHTAVFKIDKVEPGSKGRLRRGYAWVQFCVVQGEQTLILSKSGWVKVKR